MPRIIYMMLSIAAVSISGCSGDDEWAAKRPKVYQAGGIVTMDGLPLEGAVVVYHSQANDLSAQGTTDAQGKYTLTTFKQNDGAVAGANKIAVTKRTYEAVKTKYDSAEENSVAKIPKELLPKKYTSPVTSSIEVTINESGANNATIELKSK